MHAVLLADARALSEGASPDERTILATMAVKSLNPKIKVTAQLVRKENEQHLKRAEVDDIVIDGEFSGFLLASSSLMPGVHQLVQDLLDSGNGTSIQRTNIPHAFVGKSFKDLAGHYSEKHGTILIGVLTEEREISLGDIMSDDYSAIDSFILRKFKESRMARSSSEKRRYNIRLNPGADYLIQENDVAFVISGENRAAGE